MFYSMPLPIYIHPTGTDCDDTNPNVNPSIDGDTDGYDIYNSYIVITMELSRNNETML